MQTAYVLNKGTNGVLDVCGPTVEFLNSPEETLAVAWRLVINARIDVFLSGVLSGSNEPTQQQLVTDALQRAHCLLRGWCRLCIPNRSLGNGGARNVHCAGSRSGQCPWLQASALPRRAHPARSVAGQLREPVAPGPYGEVQELAHLARRESGHRDRCSMRVLRKGLP